MPTPPAGVNFAALATRRIHDGDGHRDGISDIL
jgi:hypothetical protein